MKLFVYIIAVILLAEGCAKNEHLICCAMPLVEMVRTQTQCADDWGYGTTDNETIAKLSAYLVTKRIAVTR